MNIGITVFPTYGGSGIVGSELGRELAARGHSVHFISYALPTRLCPLDDRVQFHQVDVFDYPLFEFPPYDLALASNLVRAAGTLAADMRRSGVQSSRKTSVTDLVTPADHAAEALIVNGLRAARPDDGIVAEDCRRINIAGGNVGMRGQDCLRAIERPRGMSAVERNTRGLDEGRHWIA
jgi:hypothetical protein